MTNENSSQLTNQNEYSEKENQAKQYVEKIRTDQDLNKILESLGRIGTDEQLKAGETLEALKRPVKDMMNDPNQDLPDQLSKLKEMVSELEPNYLNEGKWKQFVNKLVRKSPMEKYARKYQTIEAEVETVIGALLSGKDRLQEDSVMLHQLKEVARERIAGLNNQIEIGKQLNTMLEEELTKEEWQNDPSPVQKGQQKVLSRVKNMQQAVLVLQQSLASVDIIVENNDKLEEAIFNAITMTKNIITVTASIQLALSNQKKVIDAVRNVNQTTEAMLLSNAQLLKSNTEETLKTLEEPAVALETFKKAYEDVYAAIEMTEQSNSRIIESSKHFIEEMEQLNEQMERKLLN
ncbi:toxic anion resistance protein [Evansella tamaricis]|uniref:Toxic anion resistance protein n=1 Tax=Evansella tamaricis TaxID=2069301 RepID=A0ABS6JDP5_9BACI|nr:toxic anion resistance protein [Evansella tamaricis]MBU9711324.1 toxic anion resistance protein [Evansella tamaricis]